MCNVTFKFSSKLFVFVIQVQNYSIYWKKTLQNVTRTLRNVTYKEFDRKSKIVL